MTISRAVADAPPGEGANSIAIDGVGLTFPNGFVGLKSTSLAIPAGAFCTLLGPSGSGKTTLLRAIAGLTAATSGRVLVGGRDVTALPVQARNIGFVFQNYALFPHMNVAENIEYPLKLHAWSPTDRAKRVRDILDLVELPQAGTRAVGELSGGQQQRVAIGRALAYRPAVLLLDEPMGALDRRLRHQLGADLREIQQRTGITAVYVTHDQEEAFILSDMIAIMAHGEIQQVAAPTELYRRPRSRFVAEFLGEANFLSVERVRREGPALFATTPYGDIPVADDRDTGVGTLSVVVRPEDIHFTTGARDGHVAPIPVTVERELFLGSRCHVTVRGPDGAPLLVECPSGDVLAPGAAGHVTWRHDAAVLVDH